MRATTSLLLASAIASILALPQDTPSAKKKCDLACQVKKLGAVLQTNAEIHGPPLAASTNITVPDTVSVPGKKKHKISWPSQGDNQFIDWRTYKSSGVNLGAWMEQEANFDVDWWSANVGDYPDEWTWCEAVGKDVCGPKLEERFADFITVEDVDKMGALGINTLRIPTTYAAWIDVPYSSLYHGQQVDYIREICLHAIDKWNMHIILGLHSLPGGINGLQIGEAFGHNDWWYNTTHLDYSFRTADAVLDFIRSTGKPWAFTFAPGNEFADNFEGGFATPAGLTENGTNWINTWVSGLLPRIAKVDKRIPLMLQDSFVSETYWSPFYSADTNIVFDTHIYFFAVENAYQQYVPAAVCGDAKTLATGDGKFPVIIGEWSLQSQFNNTLAQRKTLYDTMLYVYSTYASGGSFWNYKMINDVDPVKGKKKLKGALEDYWNWEKLADAGIPSVKGVSNSYC